MPNVSCIQILKEMQSQTSLHGKEWIGLWQAIRRLEADCSSDRYRRLALERRWRFAIPAAFAVMIASIIYDSSDMTTEERGPKAQFLATLVLSGDISAEEYSVGMLGEEFLAIEGSLENITLYFGKNETIRVRTIYSRVQRP